IFAPAEELWLEGRAALCGLTPGCLSLNLRCIGLGGRPLNRCGDRRRGEELQKFSARYVFYIAQNLNLLGFCRMYSLVFIASARIVHVTFLSALETNGPPSAMNRFFTSCA